MEKLSERFMFYSGLLAAFKINHPNVDIDINAEDLKHIQDLIEAEEQGILLRLKLKVGEDFWELNNGVVYPRRAHSLQHVLYCMDRLGKVTFLTKEAAEQALNQMRGE